MDATTPGPQRVEPVAALSMQDLMALAANGEERAVARGSRVVTEGENTDALYVILEGRVRVFVTDADGQRTVLGEMVTGEYFGEMVLDGGPRSASIETLEDTQFAVVSRRVFEAYLHATPGFAERLIKHLIGRVRRLNMNVMSLAHLDLYGRVARLLIEAAAEGDGLVIREQLTAAEIARRVGATRDMVTRILKDLQTGGYITLERGAIRVMKELAAP
jgi:CRP/FNR family cyclic AMP-dependent transcriptional regulator